MSNLSNFFAWNKHGRVPHVWSTNLLKLQTHTSFLFKSIIGRLEQYCLAFSNSAGLLWISGTHVALNISIVNQAFCWFLTIICFTVCTIHSTEPIDWWLYVARSVCFDNAKLRLWNSSKISLLWKHGPLSVMTHLGNPEIAVHPFKSIYDWITCLIIQFSYHWKSVKSHLISTSKNGWSIQQWKYPFQ